MLLVMMQVDLILHVQQHYVLLMNMFQVMYVQHVLLIHQMVLVMMQVDLILHVTASREWSG